jgi:tetratricopeptide (TPR) repeat protein
MIRMAAPILAAGLSLSCAMGIVFAQEPGWQADHDAGWAAYKQGRYADAEKRLRAAEKAARAFGPSDLRLATTRDHLAWVLATDRASAEAEPLARSALAIRTRALGAVHPDVVASLNTLGCILEMDGRPEDARPFFERCLALAEKIRGTTEDATVAAALNNLATVDHALGKNAQAEAEYRRELAIRKKLPGEKPIDMAPALHDLGTLLVETRKFGEAEPLLRESLDIREKELGPDHPDVAMSLEAIGVLYIERKKNAEAEPLLKRALAIYENGLGADHPHTARCCANLAQCCRALGRTAEAEKLDSRARAIR